MVIQDNAKEPTILRIGNRICNDYLKATPSIQDHHRVDPKYYYYPPGTQTILAAYINRHKQITLDEYDKNLNKDLHKYMKPFKPKYNISPWTNEDYVNRIENSGKKKIYQQALKDINNNIRISPIVTPFSKIEKMKSNKYKAPRMIQARKPTFNITYGKYIKPLENYNKKNKHLAKGNYSEVAQKIKKLLSKGYKHFYEADHTTFDAHITLEQLKSTHLFYQTCFKHNKELRNLSKQTLKNICIARDGTKYIVNGTRMSGDVDTSFGNSLINYAIITKILKTLNVHGTAIVNGDDSIIMTKTPLPDHFDAEFKKYNMETIISKHSTNIHEIEFCRTKYVLTSSGQPTMMIDPQRLNQIYGMTFSPVALKNSQNYNKYLSEVAYCNYKLNQSNVIGLTWKRATTMTHIDETNTTLDRSMIDKIHQHAKLTEGSDTITSSMLIAWPTLTHELTKIPQREIHFERMPTKTIKMYISHPNKTLNFLH